MTILQDGSIGYPLLEEFVSEIGIYGQFAHTQYKHKHLFYKKYSEDFNCVDAEEGYNGDIHYFNEDLELVATHRIYRGDMDDWTFTELGKKLMKEEVSNYFDFLLSRM